MDGKISCVLCGQQYWYINATHLKLKHDGMTVEEYKKLYPHAPLTSGKQKATLIKGNKSDNRVRVSKPRRKKCAHCGVFFKTKDLRKKYCTRAHYDEAQRGRKMPQSVKDKISNSRLLREENKRRAWENLETAPEPPGEEELILQAFRDVFPDEKVEMGYQLEDGWFADIALVDRRIAISLYPFWSPDSKLPQRELNKNNWHTCDIFTVDPKRSAMIALNNIYAVGSRGSLKNPLFRYVSTFYQTFSDSINYRY